MEEVAAELPAHQREAFELREREGKSYREIAEIAGIELGTVKSRLNRARRKFAELISERLEEPVPAGGPGTGRRPPREQPAAPATSEEGSG